MMKGAADGVVVLAGPVDDTGADHRARRRAPGRSRPGWRRIPGPPPACWSPSGSRDGGSELAAWDVRPVAVRRTCSQPCSRGAGRRRDVPPAPARRMGERRAALRPRRRNPARRLHGDLVGVGGISLDPYAPAPGLARLRHLYVLEAHRRTGVARALVARLLELARPHFAMVRLRTRNAGAASLYESFGFAPASAKAKPTGSSSRCPRSAGRKAPAGGRGRSRRRRGGASPRRGRAWR